MKKAAQEQAVDVKEETQEVAKNTIPDLSSVDITLTYGTYDPLEFKLARSTGEQLRELQAEFYALPKDEQDKQQSRYRVDYIANLLKARPENVPNYPDTGDIKADFVTYFSNPGIEDVVDSIWTLYQRRLYPKEILSTLSD